MPELCGVCDVSVSRRKCILCILCNRWFHIECEDVSKEMFSLLDKNKYLSYKCKECMENPPIVSNDDCTFKEEIRNQFSAFKDSLKAHANDMKQQQMEINIKIDNVVSDIRKELAVNLQEIKDEVNNCKNLVHANDINTKKKFCEVELLNHLVQHRLNRADIIITGLSKDIKELTEIIISICEHLKVQITKDDILNVMYIRRNNAILVKFSNIGLRDKVMSAYFKIKNITKSDVEDGGDASRIYLSDNYTYIPYI